MITIKSLSKEHIPQLTEIEEYCFADPWSSNAFEYELTNPLSVWLVAMDGELVVGYIGSQTVLDESDIMNVAIRPEYRRNGIGHSLIMELISFLKEKGVCSLSLEVRKSNEPAIRLYTKLGFTQVGLRPNYYRHPKEDAIIMRKELT